MVHNRYQQRGGEDAVVDAEVALLANRGIEVRRFDADNDSIHGALAKIQVSTRQFVGSSAIHNRLATAMTALRPDVVHVHNWFPTVSASIFRQRLLRADVEQGFIDFQAVQNGKDSGRAYLA